MKISYNWIKEYLDLNVKPADLAEKIERTSVEVDDVTTPSDGLKKIVVGHVLSLEAHPDSDHLHICQVDVGEDEPLQIVCGAPNVAAGQNVIVALPGSRIADNVKIKKSKMRGVPSAGMICALQEIGFSEDVVPKDYVDGIYVLPADATPGDDVYDYLGMNDSLIDLDVTPNRGDMLSLFGTLHDLAAIYDQPVTLDKPEVKEAGADIADQLAVHVDEQLSPQYRMRLVKNVKLAPSPMWLQIRLWNAGLRPINNVVDITNYIMLKYGQPLHAFDYDKFAGNDVYVRTAKAGEKLTTLDENDHDLDESDIVIADDKAPIALAGVMGGLSTSIQAGTTTVAIEAAVFEHDHIRKTAQRHNLHTDASQRFERGINQTGVQEALDAAAQMMNELADGEVQKGSVVGSNNIPEPAVIELTLTHVNTVLGTDLSMDQVTHILESLGFKVAVHDDTLTVTVAVRRNDIHIPADLLEEIARIYGYDQLPATLPTGRMTMGTLTDKQRLMRATRHSLEGLGLNQAISYALTTEKKAKMFMMQASETTHLAWPMTVDHAVLRMNLVSGLLDDIAYNSARKVKDVALYEQGRVFYREDGVDRPSEEEHIAGAITGTLMPESWNQPAKAVDFYQMKGIVAAYLKDMAVNGDITYVPNTDMPEMHPGRTADILIHGHRIGFLGQIHPLVAKKFKIAATYVFELNLQAIIDMPKQENQYDVISRYPAITRDIAMLVDNDITNDQVVALIERRGGAFLQSVKLFDVYDGVKVPKGKKSLAYTLTYQDKHETLVDDAVTQAFEKVSKRLEDDLGAQIR
ncbi:phenylalanine--tRNA ligase subunit beta [Levilactobacillus tujiorum]|uniref:Phenylalanine--tRNA ligase beta subunit n=1 Tax=Levilactobacillus tujiorum TaxID=2912243 RepID=A0ABX1L3F0_9LACO|nr:phenylalanine--tRNA ligase subunit beta [Levilactobacillus tujiorum]MCH5464565.1 phenylalanine--tRNA ligase subunit beta [Levilactobacillus tujiorum]NLR11737.1 phenylalanine--tRNA ligase subunit beta [Lactobacillus sp. HBUAS51387]NLR29545.1 phenylalanine--tRNA ligase subunit beta [Levilactobacillus tujiorum]